jgi:heme/copper-type cytochrome/quinol oxidase subunit 3
MKTLKFKSYKHHPYHILSNSSVPYLLSGSLFLLALGLLTYFHNSCRYTLYTFYFGLILTIIVLIYWSFLVLEESKNKYVHNKEVESQLLFGALLFIISETMLFFGFFWAFFHSSLNPLIFVGAVFPPIGITPLNPAHWPLINTLTLLLSGIFVNGFYYTLKKLSPMPSIFLLRNIPKEIFNRKAFASAPSACEGKQRREKTEKGKAKLAFFLHNQKIYKNYFLLKSSKTLLLNFNRMHKYLLLTITLGIIFLIFQLHEYINHASFEISDGIYGSTFYMLTGLHGFHVLAGVLFLISVYIQLRSSYYSERLEPHVGITFSVLYFHYVDIVWLFLYLFVYLWGY